MKFDLDWASKRYPRQWETYKIIRAQDGFCSAGTYIDGRSGRRMFSVRIGRLELIVRNLWRVKNFIGGREHDDR